MPLATGRACGDHDRHGDAECVGYRRMTMPSESPTMVCRRTAESTLRAGVVVGGWSMASCSAFCAEFAGTVSPSACTCVSPKKKPPSEEATEIPNSGLSSAIAVRKRIAVSRLPPIFFFFCFFLCLSRRLSRSRPSGRNSDSLRPCRICSTAHQVTSSMNTVDELVFKPQRRSSYREK